jgi:hypothetical protein
MSGGSAASAWTLLFELRVGRRAARDPAARDEFRAASVETWLMAGEVQTKSRRVVAAARADRIGRQLVRA